VSSCYGNALSLGQLSWFFWHMSWVGSGIRYNIQSKLHFL